MHPILFKLTLPWIGEIPIRSFGLMVMIGVLVASGWLARAARRQGLGDGNMVGDLVTTVVITGFIGARLTYLAIHPDAYRNLISLVALWEGGLVSYGGFFGGALGGWWFAHKRGLSFLKLGDVTLPALLLGQVFGRIGCFLVGDDYGRPWDGAWAVRFPKPEGGLIPDHLVGVPLHPSQLYLSAMNLLIFGAMALVLARKRFDGQVLCLTMMAYATGRFLVEFTRGDDFERGFGAGLSTAQWWSIATLAIACLSYARLSRRARPSPSTARTAAA